MAGDGSGGSVMRCSVWSCEWEGATEDWLEHRRLAHPTVERIARERAARLGREPRADEPRLGAPGAVPQPSASVSQLSPRPSASEPGSRPAQPHCLYCGVAVKRGEVCWAHSDLPGLEPLEELVVAA